MITDYVLRSDQIGDESLPTWHWFLNESGFRDKFQIPENIIVIVTENKKILTVFVTVTKNRN